MEELLYRLDRRYQRLQAELEIKAPTLIIKNEIRLIKDACDQILKYLEEKTLEK